MKNTLQKISTIMAEMKLDALETNKVDTKELQEKYKKAYLKSWQYDFNTDKVKKYVEIMDLMYTFRHVARASYIEKLDQFKEYSDSDKVDIEIFYQTIIKIASRNVQRSPYQLTDYFKEVLKAIKLDEHDNVQKLLLHMFDIDFKQADIKRFRDIIVKRNINTFTAKDLEVFFYELFKAKLDNMGLYSVKKASIELSKLTKEVGFITPTVAKVKDTMSVITILDLANIKYDSKDFNFKEMKPKAKKAVDNGKVAVIPECLMITTKEYNEQEKARKQIELVKKRIENKRKETEKETAEK